MKSTLLFSLLLLLAIFIRTSVSFKTKDGFENIFKVAYLLAIIGFMVWGLQILFPILK